jgi:transposase
MEKRKFSKEFKAKVALAALKGDKTISELSSIYEVHSSVITRWAKQAREQLALIFGDKDEKDQDKGKLVEDLYKRIGELSVENDWLKKKLNL